MPHTIVLAGGGTGGHVYPALAMGDALRARGHTLLYYGDARRLEGRVAPERGYTFRPVEAVQYPRAGLVGKLRFALSLLSGILAARRQLRADGVTLVLGVGGYVMAPTMLGAWTLGIPTALHEANVAPGLANQLCARVTKLAFLTYAETEAKLAGSAPRVVVGCPVNPKVLQGDRAAAAARYGLDPARPTLLIVGGSLGAAKINEVALAAARDPARSYQLVHITGPRYYEEIKAAYGPLPPQMALVAYEDRMGDALALADLVLCRAGSSTLAELTAVGRASVLIPSPNVTDNHQEANARGLERAGAAQVVVEKALDMGAVLQTLHTIMDDLVLREKMSAAAKQLGKPQVAETIADELERRFVVG